MFVLKSCYKGKQYASDTLHIEYYLCVLVQRGGRTRHEDDKRASQRKLTKLYSWTAVLSRIRRLPVTEEAETKVSLLLE